MVPAKNLSMQYEFKVGGIIYKAHRIAFYSMLYPETLVFAKNKKVGDSIDVFYDPANPENATLIRENSEPGMGVGIAIFAT